MGVERHDQWPMMGTVTGPAQIHTAPETGPCQGHGLGPATPRPHVWLTLQAEEAEEGGGEAQAF